jgi:hypothetical protein
MRRVYLLLVAGLVASAGFAGLSGTTGMAENRYVQLLGLAAALAALGLLGDRIGRVFLQGLPGASRATASFAAAVGLVSLAVCLLGLGGVLRWPAFLLVLAAGMLALAELSPPETGEAPAPDPGGNLWLEGAALAGLAAVLWGWLREIWDLRFIPAGYFAFDDLSYHLTAVATWLRSGDLRMVKLPAGDPSTPFYPVLGEAASWTLLAPFSGSDFLARWSQLPFAAFSLVALYAVARRLGQPRWAAWTAVALYASIPRAFPDLALTAGNDHTLSFATLAGVEAVLLVAAGGGLGAWAYLGLALGLLIGTKYLGLIVAATLGVVAVVWRPSRGKGLLVLTAVCLLAGGYCYLRNWVTTGNPIFPSPVRLFGAEIFAGWESTGLAARRSSPEAAIDVAAFLTRRPDLLGSWFPWTLLPAVFVAPLLAGFRRDRRAWVYLLPIVLFLQFRFIVHDHRDIRYILAALALAAVACTSVLATFLGRWRWPVALPAWKIPRKALLLAAALAGILLLAPGFAVYQEKKWRDLPAESALDRFVGPAGAEVAYVGFNTPYLFFGRSLQNDLRMIPTGEAFRDAFFDWGASPDSPFEYGKPRRWLHLLEAQGIDYVVMVSDPSTPAAEELAWIEARPGRFARVYRDGRTAIWRVARE